MPKGVAALAHLPAVDILFPTANAACSIEALRGAAFLVARLQEEGAADAAYTNLIATGNNPYDSSTWNITVAGSGTTFTCVFVSEVSTVITNDRGRAALSTRRLVDVIRNTGATFDFTVRSLLALIEFIVALEDRVAESGTGTAGDGTYTDYPTRGNTPFETYEWTVTKADNAYTIVSTANS